MEAAAVWRFGLVEAGKSMVFPEGFRALVSPCFVVFPARKVGFGGVTLILRDVVKVWVGNFNGFSNPG